MVTGRSLIITAVPVHKIMNIFHERHGRNPYKRP
jgi:hypothetical protein